MPSCPNCGAQLETPLGCQACGAVLLQETAPTPFEVFGLAPGFAVDQRDLRRRLVRFSRLVHPDFFGEASGAERARAEHSSALLNTAFGILSDDFRRADHLVRSLNGPAEGEQREMPQAFLMEVMEWNEALERAREEADAEAREDLTKLHFTLQGERTGLFRSIREKLVPLPTPGSPVLADVRKELNAVRYVDRALREIEALRLGRSAARS